MTAQASAVAAAAGAVLAVPGTLRGWSIKDTSGAANTVKLYDNASAASGTLLASIALAANGSSAVSIADGVRAAAGIYLSATGALEGSVWVG